MDRRTFIKASTAITASQSIPAIAQHHDGAAAEHMRMMSTPPADAPTVAMLIYPQMVAMDLIGPLTIFNAARFDRRLVWKSTAPVVTVEGLPFAARHNFDDCPLDIDVLFVPGGTMGTIECMNDPVVLRFLAERGAKAKWVTSVCTGGLVLGAAGLLVGYDATAHWAVADLLPLMGARHVDQRVVRDRNRMTGGGVTAGIDFALTLVAEMRGEEAARRAALTVEYAPTPPVQSGTPQQAGPARTAAIRQSRAWMDEQARLAAEHAGKRLGTA